MKLATWNVNSLRVRLPHLVDWLAVHGPDVVCIQETKLEDDNFPRIELGAAGYETVFSGQRTYNGVAIAAKHPLIDIQTGIPGFADEQKRLVAATVNGVRIVCVYVPNGQQVGAEKYDYKLRWLAGLESWLGGELCRYPRLALLGDLNIAPADEDVHDPKAWEDKVLFSPKERQAFQRLVALGFKDSFRLFTQPDRCFSWWDYRINAFKRNLGLRIDHILLSAELAACCKSTVIDSGPRRLERPSDHAPVIAELELGWA